MRREFRARSERLTEQKKPVIDRDEHECHADSNVRLAAMHANPKRNADQRKSEASKGKSNLLMDLHPNGRGHVLELLSQLLFSRCHILVRVLLQSEWRVHSLFDIAHFRSELGKGHVGYSSLFDELIKI